MYLSHLSLTHFRNYRHLELDFSGPLTLFQGQNAQGKTNLLEAIYFMATSKPVHARAEREVVGWDADEEPIPYTRLATTVRKDANDTSRPLELEILLTQRENSKNFQKQIRINGVNRRGIDLVGQMRAVLFLPEDIDLISGSPSVRRRYLDISLCQMDREYTRALSQFQKIVTRRNSLLRTLREDGANPRDASVGAQLDFWDEQLMEHGSMVMARRYNYIKQLEGVARARHSELSGQRESLALQYIPSFNPGYLSDAEFEQLREGTLPPAETAAPQADLSSSTVREHYQRKLHSRRSRELAAGTTMYGPHRDDLRMLANGRDLRTYGSRGQQRTAALSLKLAEVQAMIDITGEAPLLLLDDVMSELDSLRRQFLLTALEGVPQSILTTTDLDTFSPQFCAQAQLFHVHAGTVHPATTPFTTAPPNATSDVNVESTKETETEMNGSMDTNAAEHHPTN